MENLKIADKTFTSRLFTGTGKFSSNNLMRDALLASGSELVTLALKRIDINNDQDKMLSFVSDQQFNLLPNTSGVRTAKEAIFAAEPNGLVALTHWSLFGTVKPQEGGDGSKRREPKKSNSLCQKDEGVTVTQEVTPVLSPFPPFRAL